MRYIVKYNATAGLKNETPCFEFLYGSEKKNQHKDSILLLGRCYFPNGLYEQVNNNRTL